MNKKIFVTGGKGMLASEICSFYASKGLEIIAPDIDELDITDSVKTRQEVLSLKPAIVFHTAAMHVDPCEEDPESAYKINTWASQNLARACEETGSQLVYISSCGYFGDEIKAYSEYDDVVLKTVYARSKHAGEVFALKECSRTFAVRPGWLFGGSIKHKKNFVYQRYLEALKSPLLKSAGDKYGSPTYIGDLVKKIAEVISSGHFGLYHISNSGGCSRAEYVKKIISSCGLKTNVEAVDSSAFPRKANVPSCEILNNWNLKFTGISPMPSWEDAIERYCKIMLREPCV